MKENFSKGVQRVLKYAKEEAVRLGHSYVGSEHLLLGIIKDNNGKNKNDDICKTSLIILSSPALYPHQQYQCF